MCIKSVPNVESHFVASLVLAFILFSIFPFNLSAQTQSLPNSLSLTIKLQSAYNPGVKLCTPISVNDQLEYSWTRDRGLVHSSISMLVAKPEDGVYPVKFVLKEGMLDGMREV